MTQPIKLLIVDDSAEDREIYARMLQKDPVHTYVTAVAGTGAEGVELARSAPPDCIVLDFNLPDMDALEVLEKLSGPEHELPCAVVLVTGQGSEKIAVESLKLGVHDYLVKGEITGEKIARAIAKAVEKVSARRRSAKDRVELERMALTDPLTGLGNRNLFNARLAHAVALVRRRNERACLLVLDLDGLKKINDSLGHHVGDEVLREVARRITSAGRAADTIARLGGDEFAFLMETGATVEGAMTVANKIIQLVKQPIVTNTSVFCVGISVGIAMFDAETGNAEEIVRHADEAMYAAKQGGGGVRMHEYATSAAAAVLGFGRAKRRA